jgi:hypothetical protein
MPWLWMPRTCLMLLTKPDWKCWGRRGLTELPPPLGHVL